MDTVIIVTPPGNTAARIYSMNEAGMLSKILSLNNYKVIIFDFIEYSNPVKEIIKIIIDEKPAFVIGVFMWSDILKNQYFLNFFRDLEFYKDEIHFIALGRAASIMHEVLFDNYKIFDTVIIGEYEKTIIELFGLIINKLDYSSQKGIAYKKNNSIILSEKQDVISDLDALPMPDYSYLRNKNLYPIAPLYTSRYCYGKCSFCLNKIFHYTNSTYEYRARSVDLVIKEIEEIVNNYKIDIFYFLDNNFFVDGVRGKIRAKEFAEKIIEKNLKIKYYIECRVNDVEIELFTLLKKSGLRTVFIGIESFSQNFLDRYLKETTITQNEEAIKILKELNINFEAGFIMFEPSSTIEDIKQNIYFIKKNGLNNPMQTSLLSSMCFYNKNEFHDLIDLNENNDVCNNRSIPYSFKNQKVKLVYKFCKDANDFLIILNKIYYEYLNQIDNLFKIIKDKKIGLLSKTDTNKELINIYNQISKWNNNQIELNINILEKIANYIDEIKIENIDDNKIKEIYNLNILDYHKKYFNRNFEENKSYFDLIISEFNKNTDNLKN